MEIAQLERALRQSESNAVAVPDSAAIDRRAARPSANSGIGEARRSRFKSGPRRDLESRQSLGRRGRDRGMHGVGWHRQAQARMSVAREGAASHRYPSSSRGLTNPDRNSLICRCGLADAHAARTRRATSQHRCVGGAGIPEQGAGIYAGLTSGASRPVRPARGEAGESDRARRIGEREPRKAEQDGARTIKPFVAPHRI
jgi:hypothetical protein